MGHSVKEEKMQLMNQLEQYGNLFETGFILTDPTEGKDLIVSVNRKFTEITGYSLEEVRGKNLQFLHGENTDMNVIRNIDRRLRLGEGVNEEVVHYRKDGSSFWSEFVIQPIIGETGEILFINSLILDITKRKIDESLLNQHKRIFAGISEGKELEELLQNVSTTMSPFVSSEATCAYLFENLKGDWVLRKPDSFPEVLTSTIEAGIESGMRLEWIKGELLFDNKIPPNQSHDFVANWSFPVYDQAGRLSEVFLVFVKEQKSPSDVQIQYLEGLVPVIQMAKAFIEQQNRLHSLAYFELSTGLPNRYGFLEKLKEMLKTRKSYFVAIVAPSEYANIIDLYGRDAADELFLQLARRIEKNEAKNFVGRLSSALLIFTNERSTMDAKEFINQVRKITAEPFIVAGKEIFISLKIGISLGDNESCAEEMLRRADTALTDAKGRPGGTVSFYRDLQNEETIKEMTIINELIRTLAVDGLEVYLQPKVDLKTSEIIGFEALARWHSPILGQVSPSVFIPIAESIGKIIELEVDVLTKVLRWQRMRNQSGKKMYQVAVNISVDHFFDPSFVLTVKNLAEKYGVQAKYIRLEMTESIGLVDFDRAKEIFGQLNTLGFELSIDDFGVGYSSLSYLPQLQVSELKIDRSFINALHDPGTYAVVMAIIQLANNLNIVTVAEGIEEVYQIEALVPLGCQVGQGFHYYKPMAFDEIDAIIE